MIVIIATSRNCNKYIYIYTMGYQNFVYMYYFIRNGWKYPYTHEQYFLK